MVHEVDIGRVSKQMHMGESTSYNDSENIVVIIIISHYPVI